MGVAVYNSMLVGLGAGDCGSLTCDVGRCEN